MLRGGTMAMRYIMRRAVVVLSYITTSESSNNVLLSSSVLLKKSVVVNRFIGCQYTYGLLTICHPVRITQKILYFVVYITRIMQLFVCTISAENQNFQRRREKNDRVTRKNLFG